MRARHVSLCAVVLALALAAACTGNGGTDKKRESSPAGSKSTRTGPPIPVGRTEVAGALWDGKIAVAGGFPSPDASTDRLDLFELSSCTWSQGPTLPHRYDHASLAELGARLHVVGGYKQHGGLHAGQRLVVGAELEHAA